MNYVHTYIQTKGALCCYTQVASTSALPLPSLELLLAGRRLHCTSLSLRLPKNVLHHAVPLQLLARLTLLRCKLSELG